MTRRRTMTDARGRMLAAIVAHVRAEQWPPTYRELGATLGISNNAINDTLIRLERDGLIERERMRSRAIRLTPDGRVALAEWERESARRAVA